MVTIIKDINIETIPVNSAINGDCMIYLEKIKDNSVNMVFVDLPYGITSAVWDIVLPMNDYIEVNITNKIVKLSFNEYILHSVKLNKSYNEIQTEFENNHKKGLWYHYKRILKDNGVVIMTANQPFSSYLINSNLEWYKYNYVWVKNTISNHLNAKKQPLRKFEDVLVFYKNQCTYNPILTDKLQKDIRKGNNIRKNIKQTIYGQQREFITNEFRIIPLDKSYPVNVLNIDREFNGHTFHPTQKPTELIEYLIKTFTNETDVVLDNTAGSLSTAISCLNTNRNFIVMELNSEYFNKGVEEINKWTKKEEINIRTKKILNF